MNEFTASGPESKDQRGRKHFPYRDAAWAYRERGWTGTIPVTRRGTKAPLVKGVTGHNGTDPSDELLTKLIAEFPTANIGIRLPWSIVGIDVDAYDERGGDATIASLEKTLDCPLPVTWRSTSRDDGVSGIYLFYAPRSPFQVWVTDLGAGSGVEIAQYHHRFATVSPSIHNSTGRQYWWYRGRERSGIPRPEELPWLPVKWGDFLLSSREYVVKDAAADAVVAEWYRRVSGGVMCKYMLTAAEREAGKIRAATVLGGLHDTLIAAVTHLCNNAAEGHLGLDVGLSVVEDAFKTSGRRRNLGSEWTGAVNTAMAKAAAIRPQETVDVCSLDDDWRRTS